MGEGMKSFPQKLDYRFLISGEMISGRGEDSFYLAQKDHSAVAAVFDGCGGLGCRRYRNYRGHTGAYMASRAASGALHDWYHTFQGGSGTGSGIEGSADDISRGICGYMNEALDVVRGHAGQTARIFGTMVRDFPTTAAVALIQDTREGTLLQCFWAGDSRVYLLDRHGLAQLTMDDVEGEDALSNLRADGALSNVIASDRRYVLHAGPAMRFREDEPYAVFAATDGCFGYLQTPMDFEDLLLTSLMESPTPKQFKHKLEENIRDAAGDDYTFAFISVGYGSYRSLQEALAERRDFLHREYMEKLDRDSSGGTLARLWEKYRVGYERCLSEMRGGTAVSGHGK